MQIINRQPVNFDIQSHRYIYRRKTLKYVLLLGDYFLVRSIFFSQFDEVNESKRIFRS